MTHDLHRLCSPYRHDRWRPKRVETLPSFNGVMSHQLHAGIQKHLVGRRLRQHCPQNVQHAQAGQQCRLLPHPAPCNGAWCEQTKIQNPTLSAGIDSAAQLDATGHTVQRASARLISSPVPLLALCTQFNCLSSPLHLGRKDGACLMNLCLSARDVQPYFGGWR